MDQLTYVANFHDDDAVKKMSYQPLGNTGLSVSRISLGGGPLGDMYGSNKEEEYIATVHLALKSGINYIDTAPWYGNGRSEEVIGKALKDVPRSAYYIGTKVGRYEQDLEKQFDFSGKRVEQSVDASLKLLGLNYVDVIQVHDLEFAESLDIILEETLPALQKVVEQGKARHIGITGYPLHLLQEVIERSSINIELVLSYARNTLLDDTLKEFIPFFQSRNIGVINAAAVSMGLLCHGNLVGWHPATQNIKDACQQAAQFCKDTGVDLGRLAVQHSLKLDGVSTHLMGNNNTNILRKNLDSVLTPPTPLEEKVALELKLKFFDPLPRKHWEGVGPAQYWKSLRQLRGELPQDD
ncbi:L-galactose dehydrogenase-like isoform X1 [Homarus americanus]|uniref:L-galactose dehydrogenase-like isoform X1 n=1 Tax=Homarus americanus TaxID=6706 RepID=UPI001C45A579|nr:L-galactose dehydrogenase-like isoform X1 [Homarus americanus]